MDYLSKKSFVHRDLAARNVLVNESLTCKVGGVSFMMQRAIVANNFCCNVGLVSLIFFLLDWRLWDGKKSNG